MVLYVMLRFATFSASYALSLQCYEAVDVLIIGAVTMITRTIRG